MKGEERGLPLLASMHIVHLQGAVKGGELLSLDEPMMIEVFFFTADIYIYIYTVLVLSLYCIFRLYSLYVAVVGMERRHKQCLNPQPP